MHDHLTAYPRLADVVLATLLENQILGDKNLNQNSTFTTCTKDKKPKLFSKIYR